MRLLILLLIPFIQLHGQQVRFEEYFQLKKGDIQTYFVSHITETDTLTDDPKERMCGFERVKTKKIYYFTEDIKGNERVSSVGPEVFCHGVFYFEDGNFMFSPIYWKDDLKKINLGYFEKLFPVFITPDSVYKYKNCDEKRTYRFIGFETINIKHQSIDSCLKLVVEQDWPTAHYEDIVWFKKNVGVVKWLRGTGRLEELKSD